MIASKPRPILASKSPAHRPVIVTNRLELFGGGTLANANGPITGRAVQRHRVALLALLATTRRLYRNRDQLITFLWPDTNAERGRKLLSDSIYRVNRALGGDAITGIGDDLRLNRALLASDVADFEAAVDAHDWRPAVELYAGPFLDGFFLPGSTDFDQWMEVERAQYARAFAKALETLAIEARDGGRAAESVDWWHRLAVVAPDDSRIAMELMRALETAGNRARALAQAREHSDYLRNTVGMEPDPAVQKLAERIAAPAEENAVLGAIARPGAAIAVLPFTTLSAPEETSYFADGVSEELMYLLARTAGIRVTSRTSAFAYRDLKIDVREVGRRLQVDWVLEGSVRRAGEALRVAVHLTDARNGYLVWSEAFDRSSNDLFAMQAEIASTIAQRIAPSIDGAIASALPLVARAASDADTYDLYFQAQFHAHRRTEDSLRKAAVFFERIVDREPSNARAWAGLAEAYAVLAFYDFVAPRIAFPKAESAARRATELDTSLAGPHATLAHVATYFHWQWEAAERGFRRAMELDPASATVHQLYACFLVARGRFVEAEREMRRGAELDPLSMVMHSSIGWALALANQNERAIRQLYVALHLNTNYCLANYWMGVALEQNGQPSQAVAYIRRSIELAPDSTLQRAALARAYASAGDIPAARDVLDDLLRQEREGRYISSYQIAKAHHAMGDVDAALSRLERAYDDRAHAMAYLAVDPQLKPLADHPRFRRLLQQIDAAAG